MLALVLLVLPAMGMTVQEAVDAALQRTPVARLGEARVEGAEARLRQATASLLPSASLSGGAAWQTEITLDLNEQFEQAFADSDLPLDTSSVEFPPMEVLPGFQWQGAAEARQAILAPGAWLYRRAAREGVEAATSQKGSDRWEVATGVVRAWHISARSHAVLQEAEAARDLALPVADRARAAADLGVLPEDEVIPAEEAVATARAGVERARAGVRSADAALQRLTGQDEAVARLPDSPPELPPLDQVLRGLERPDLEAARSRAEAADALAQATWAPALPNLGVQGTVMYADPTSEFMDPWFWQVRLGLSVPLVQGGKVRAQVQEARAGARQAQAGLDALRERAEVEIIGIHGELASALASLERWDEAVRLSERSVEVAQARFDEGGGSLLALERARAHLSQARLSRLQARADALLHADLLALAAGGLERFRARHEGEATGS